MDNYLGLLHLEPSPDTYEKVSAAEDVCLSLASFWSALLLSLRHYWEVPPGRALGSDCVWACRCFAGSETSESPKIKLSLSDDPEQAPRKPRSLYPVPRDRFDPSQNKVAEAFGFRAQLLCAARCNLVSMSPDATQSCSGCWFGFAVSFHTSGSHTVLQRLLGIDDTCRCGSGPSS